MSSLSTRAAFPCTHKPQVLMVMWVLLMRGLAMPKVVDASKEAFGLDKPAADAAAATDTAAAAAAPGSGGKAGRKAAGKSKQAKTAAGKKDE